MFGDAIYGDLILGGGSLASSDDPDSPITIVVINDVSGRITYLSKTGVKILSENSSVYVFNEEPSWVKILE